ncbi:MULTISPECIES: methyl-accepting chemotaxis protein [Vibrio]|nr:MULTISPECIES: methyl-accepting chemotaxis protein [Vibrio]
MMLTKLNIGQKVFLMGAAQLLIMVVMGWYALSQMNKIGNELVEIAEEDIPLMKKLTVITEHQLEQAIYFERAMVKAIRLEQGLGSKDAFIQYKNKVHDLTLKTEAEIIDAEQFIKDVIPLLHSPAAKAAFQDILMKLEQVESAYDNLLSQVDAVLLLGEQGRIDEMLTLSVQVEALEDQLDRQLIAILEQIQDFTLASARQAEADEKHAIQGMTVLLVASVVLSILLPLMVTRAIRNPILTLIERLQQVADGDGDLRVRLDATHRDETGKVAGAFNQFLSVLTGTLESIHTQTHQLGQSSQSAKDSMQRMLSNVEQQRSDIEQVATAITQMHYTTQEVATSTANASSVTDQVKQRVMDGQRDAVATQSVIQSLADEVSTSSTVIENLVAETNNIGQVLESIQGIAEQTNLLALNAAIEAARAGDTGRGFAVVADEVRVLAQRTQVATVDIQELVERLKTEAQNAITSMQRGNDTARVCLEKSSEAAATFSDAAEAVGQIASLNLQIATAAEEQSSVANEINSNLESIRMMAEQTAAETHNTADESEAIAGGVDDLYMNIRKFQI